MSRSNMLTIFCYDVSENKRRRKVAKVLEGNATRVQYSVFETRMSRRQADNVGQQVAAHLGDGDSLRIYSVGRNGERRSRVYGDGPPFESNEGYWLF